MDPPGYVSPIYDEKTVQEQNSKDKKKPGSKIVQNEEESNVLEQLKIKKAWDTALAPSKSIPMNGFMLYMSGNSVQIFSILITVMLLFNSIKAVIGANSVFDRFRNTNRSIKNSSFSSFLNDPLLVPILVYIIMQLANFGLGVWKCSAMGLLPTSSSDWLAFLPPRRVM